MERVRRVVAALAVVASLCACTGDDAVERAGGTEGDVGAYLATGAEGSLDFAIVVPGGPADLGGIQPGEPLVAVGDRDADDLGLGGASELLAGPIGSTVRVTVGAEARRRSVVLTRAAGRAEHLGAALDAGAGPETTRPAGEAIPVTDPSSWELAFPQLATLGPPPWLRPGHRLLIYGSAASIPAVRTQLVPDANGNWVHSQTGQTFSPQDAVGAGGAGVSVIDVGHVDEQVVVASQRSFVLDANTGALQFTGSGAGYAAHAAALADYWIHPSVLRSLPETYTNGAVIGRQQVNVGGRTFDGIRLSFGSATGQSSSLYDLDTGLLLTQSTLAEGAAVPTVNPDGTTSTTGAGSTLMTYSQIIDLRLLDLPWSGSAAPPAVDGFRPVRLQGGLTLSVPDAGQSTFAASAVISPRAGTSHWLRYATASVTESAPGLPPTESRGEGASGSSTLLGLWIPPDAIGQLRAGQVLDSDPILKVETRVDRVEAAGIVITETGPTHSYSVRYDTRTGLFNGIELIQQNGLGRSVLALEV
jgi:hypothetical protein